MHDEQHQALSEFLFNFYNDEEIEELIFKHFPLVSRDFTQSMSFRKKIIVILEYCRRHDQVSQLLEALRHERPEQFDQYFIPPLLDHRHERNWENGPIWNVPNLPPYFLDRQVELSALKPRLLVDEMKLSEGSKIPAIGIHGMGGIGKTVSVTVLAQDQQIRQKFNDGAFWVTLGQRISWTRRYGD